MDVAEFSNPRDPWYKVWLTVYFRPSVKSYENLLSARDANISRSYKWIAITTGISAIIPLITYFVSNRAIIPNDLVNILRFGEIDWVLYPISVISAVLIAPFLFFVAIKIINWSAQKLGGVGKFEHLGFLVGAAYAPMILLDNLLEITFPPLLGLIFRFGLLGLLGLYTAISIRTVHRLDWSRSLLLIFILGALLMVVAGCSFVVLAF